jgi:hypothetical protein
LLQSTRFWDILNGTCPATIAGALHVIISVESVDAGTLVSLNAHLFIDPCAEDEITSWTTVPPFEGPQDGINFATRASK